MLGALRVKDIAEPSQSWKSVSPENQARARGNAHFLNAHDLNDEDILPSDERVFLGAKEYSRRFLRPIDLGATKPSGIMYRAFTSSRGSLLTYGMQPSWQSSLRSCRRIWDLRNPADLTRAGLVRSAILQAENFDLLRDI